MTRPNETPVFALLHGGGQGSWVWSDTACALADAGAKVILLDAPGCGVKRGRDLAALGLDDIVDELLADLRDAEASDVVLVGHSLAGTMLPRLAKADPARFRRLVYLTCSAPLPGVSPFAQMGAGKQGDHPDQVGRPLDPATTAPDDQYRAMFCNDMAPAEAAAFLAQLGTDQWPMDVMTSTDWRYDHLAGLPATYIVCDRDRALPPDWQLRFAERLHVERIIHIDAGHQAMNTQPTALAALLLAEAAR